MQSLEGRKVIYLTKIYTVHNVHNVYHVYWIVVTHCWLYYLKRYFSTCNVTSHKKCIYTQNKPCTILVKMSRSALRNLYLLNFSLKSMGSNHAHQCLTLRCHLDSALSPWLRAVPDSVQRWAEQTDRHGKPQQKRLLICFIFHAKKI